MTLTLSNLNLIILTSIMENILSSIFSLFFFNDTATTEIYTLSLHDALPIYPRRFHCPRAGTCATRSPLRIDRKSTRLNSSHGYISYAVFCLKKKKTSLDDVIFGEILCGCGSERNVNASLFHFARNVLP